MRTRNRFSSVVAMAAALMMIFASAALASEVDVAVVDVTVPTNSVTLAPGGSGPITINMTVNGNQAGTATFEVYRDWTLSGGTFTGSNPQEFTVAPRTGGDLATTFSTTGTVSAAAGQADGTFTLAVGAFDITNTNATGAKLAAGNKSNYSVTVATPVVVPPSDSTPPEIAITKPGNGAEYTLNQVVNADYSCEDEAGGSGLKSCVGTVANGAAIDTSSVGSKSFTVDAEDNAGNKSHEIVNYSVIYDFDGFYRPIENLPILNRVKGGSAVPVKFSLGGNQGVSIFASGFPSSKSMTCGNGPVDPIGGDELVTAGNSSLQYDALTDTYTYVWKTDKSWTSGCRQLSLKLADGKVYTANFAFTK